MAENLSRKLIASHLLSGQMIPGEEIAISADQWLSHDMNAPMGFLGFETLGIDRIQIPLGVVYMDHNLVQVDFKTRDDFLYLQDIAARYGIHYSRPGNGICHILHYHRYAMPGKVLIGADSHSSMSGCVGMLAIAVGGLEGALVLAGSPYYFKMPKICAVRLTGKLRPGVSSRDLMHEILRRLTVKGGIGWILEYCGEGLKTLSVPERATLANMGAEVGATTSVFPCDERTREFLKAQGHEEWWQDLRADEGAQYDKEMCIDLSELEPLVCCPNSPDNVKPARELKDVKVSTVVVGSCTSASYPDIARVAAVMEGHVVHPDVSFSVAVGTRDVYEMLARDGILTKLFAAGVRLLEVACGPCNGVGQAPETNGVTLRTQNRNFFGRSGTKSASIYLSSPEVAAASAITGRITLPEEVCDVNALAALKDPDRYFDDDRMVIKPLPLEEARKVQIRRGPNIKPMPVNTPLPDALKVPVSIKCPDNISTDDIVPAGTTLSNMRSNVPGLSEYLFSRRFPGAVDRIKAAGKSIIVGGENYGQGSSREHAALIPMYLGVKAVLAKSLARIHRDNLVNYGVLPLFFENKDDYEKIAEGDVLEAENLHEQVRSRRIVLKNVTSGAEIPAVLVASDREIDILMAGGKLPYTKALFEKKQQKA